MKKNDLDISSHKAKSLSDDYNYGKLKERKVDRGNFQDVRLIKRPYKIKS